VSNQPESVQTTIWPEFSPLAHPQTLVKWTGIEVPPEGNDMQIKRTVRNFLTAAALAGAATLALPTPQAHAAVFVSVGIAPPAIPVYAQPECPGDGYIWTPGYWAWGPDGYYWVDGAWVEPPYEDALWTPGWWGWGGGAYLWYPGYWGRTVGYYGGINYGFGYFGTGFYGGYWHGGHFWYNRAYNHFGHGFHGNFYNRSYAGFNGLYDPGRRPAPITPAFCWAHARRQFFELADIAKNARRGGSATAISPIALEAVKRVDALFDIERNINGLTAAERLHARQENSAPLLAELETWLREQRSKLSRSAAVIKPIDYMLKRWNDFARFVEDGRICLTNNAAERALRGLALGRRAWVFAGSDRGADRAAVMITLIMTARLNDIDPQAWLADVFARTAEIPQNRLHELLPWNWKLTAKEPATAQAA